jgi:predicted transcriptional regulator
VDSHDEEVIDLLEKLGLSSYEGRVYVGLLQTGAATPYRIAKQVGIPVSKVYEVFKRLALRGFITEVTGSEAGYVARDPESVLAEIADSHRATIEAASDRLRRFKSAGSHSVAWNVQGRDEVIACGRRIAQSARFRLAIAAPTPIADDWLGGLGTGGPEEVLVLCAQMPGTLRPSWKWQRLTPANSMKVLRTAAVLTADDTVALFAETDAEEASYHGSWTESRAIVAMAVDYAASLAFIGDVFDKQWIPWGES